MGTAMDDDTPTGTAFAVQSIDLEHHGRAEGAVHHARPRAGPEHDRTAAVDHIVQRENLRLSSDSHAQAPEVLARQQSNAFHGGD
jgi:hypothetical protein